MNLTFYIHHTVHTGSGFFSKTQIRIRLRIRKMYPDSGCIFTIFWFRYSFLHFFVKVPRPGDSEVTFSVFESSYHLLPPV